MPTAGDTYTSCGEGGEVEWVGSDVAWDMAILPRRFGRRVVQGVSTATSKALTVNAEPSHEPHQKLGLQRGVVGGERGVATLCKGCACVLGAVLLLLGM